MMEPGLLQTDSVRMPGVANNLILSTILPRDEDEYFGNPTATMDQSLIDLTTVCFSYSFYTIIFLYHLCVHLLAGVATSHSGFSYG